MAENDIIRIGPYSYIHVLDNNSNIVRVVIGPKTFVRQEHEKVLTKKEPMVIITAQQYCVIKNPVRTDENNEIKYDKYGQVELVHGDLEYRFHQNPFPLYPGEILHIKPTELQVVLADEALVLYAINDFVDENGVKRISGDKWLFEGPGTYLPRKEVKVESKKSALEVKPNTALHMRASKNCIDNTGKKRVFGEEWLVKDVGAYMPTPYEDLVKIDTAINIDEHHALLVQALRTHKDSYGYMRNHGQEWLITCKDTESHILSVNERKIELREATTLNNRQYCVILNPVDENCVPQYGKKKLVKGDAAFFLQPGESLEHGIQNSYILNENEALILQAEENIQGKQAGEKWMICGPTEYIPPVEVKVLDKRCAIPLDENEGIYVRDVKTGKVRSVIGQTYILNQDEVLWEKKLPDNVKSLLLVDKKSELDCDAPAVKRNMQNAIPNQLDFTRVITFRVPHNAAVQIYDYKEKQARVIFGPELVMLGPDEQFTQISLSGGKPKRPNVIRSLCLLLGPDFSTDIVIVETADHARLSLQLSYNWHFLASPEMPQSEAAKLFAVPDFIGDACKAIASRVRGTVAAVQFDDFHKNSARIIRSSVFGLDENGKVKNSIMFSQNNLVVTSIDVQSVEPVDQRTRDSLQKSVQLAIEITTNSQEATARHEAERLEQEARGRLERQKIKDEASAEESRRKLLELQVQSAALESTGQAKAEAQSRAEAAKIEGQAAVESAKFKAAAADIDAEGELQRLTAAREAELEFVRAKYEITMKAKTEKMQIEVQKFTRMMDSIGADNLKALASAGPNQDIRMLKALGLQSTLITDGSSPINLLQTAQGLIGSALGKTSGLKNAAYEDKDKVNPDDIDLEYDENIDLE